MNQPLEHYISNTARIRSLSAPSIQDIDNAADYGTLLRDNFITIGQLARENRNILAEHLFPFLEEGTSVSDSDIKGLGDFGDSLLDAYTLDNLDPAIHAEISDRLLEKAEHSGSVKIYIQQLDREVTACYTMQNITQRLKSFPDIAEKYRKRGFAAGRKLLQYLEKEAFFSLPDNECREIVLINARYLWELYEGSVLSEEECRDNLKQLEKALALAEDEEYRKRMPWYDWRHHTMRTLQYILILPEYNNARQFPKDVLDRIYTYAGKMNILWHEEPEYYKELVHENEMMVLLLRARYLCGKLSAENYRHNLMQLYNTRDKNNYELGGMTMNLMLPTEYILTLNRDHLTEEDKYQINRFYRDALNYAFHMSGRDSLSFMLEFLSHLLDCFIEIPGGMDFNEMCLNCLGALHPPTYVHSIMVGQIARCLCRHLMKMKPELFADLPMAGDPDAILSFTYRAAVCHDFGKLPITDTIMVYGRKLLDSEFSLLKTHPETAAELMRRHVSTRPYVNIALGHHRWYDNSAGYPEDLNTKELPEKVIIDIVCCADCLDAATDSVGRSYNRGKTMDDFIGELKEGAGTRYAPYLPELFDNKELRRDLRFLLQQGRRSSYSKVYRQLKDLTDQSQLYGDEPM